MAGECSRNLLATAEMRFIMLLPRRYNERGHANHGWLDTYHTFSFNTYYDPDFMGFRALRVINEDVIAPAQGFGTHPHNNMEIVTYVLDGALAHRDSIGSEGVIRPGEIQQMSAGTGIYHSEFNASASEPVHLLQIWVEPSKRGVPPNYNQKAISVADNPGKLVAIATPDGRDGSLPWVADADLLAAHLDAGDEVEHSFVEREHGWLQVGKGSVQVNGLELRQGDGVAISNEAHIRITAGADGAEFLLFELE